MRDILDIKSRMHGDDLDSTVEHFIIWQAEATTRFTNVQRKPTLVLERSKHTNGKIKNAITQTFDNIATAFAVPAFA